MNNSCSSCIVCIDTWDLLNVRYTDYALQTAAFFTFSRKYKKNDNIDNNIGERPFLSSRRHVVPIGMFRSGTVARLVE